MFNRKSAKAAKKKTAKKQSKRPEWNFDTEIVKKQAEDEPEPAEI